MKQSEEESPQRSVQGAYYKSPEGLESHGHGQVQGEQPAIVIPQKMEPVDARAVTRPVPFPNLAPSSSLEKRKDIASRNEPTPEAHTEGHFIHVPSVSSKAVVSRQMILTEITKSLGLTIYSTGTKHESPFEIRGWVDIEVLPSEDNSFATKRRFYGGIAHTTDRASKNACQSAITHLMTKCRVKVDDANFSQVTDLQRKLSAATDFENMFKESEEVKMKYMASLKESNEKILDALNQICVDSVGFLPIKVSPFPSDQSGNMKIQYDGTLLATKPKEKLASSLVALASTKLIAGLFPDHGKH